MPRYHFRESDFSIALFISGLAEPQYAVPVTAGIRVTTSNRFCLGLNKPLLDKSLMSLSIFKLVIPPPTVARHFLLLIFVHLVAAAAVSGLPQAPAPGHTIHGTVFDPSLANVAGAEVNLTTSNNQEVASTKTDRAGLYLFDNLARGKYRLQIHAAGFKDVVSDVTVGAKPLGALRITLAIAPVSEVVNVTADDAISQASLDTGENQDSNNVTRDALDRVPVFDQDYVSLLSRFLRDDTIGTNGVSLIVNGVEANGPGVSASAVQEVKINQNPYAAQFSRPGRARLEIITKPGTPQFHGTINFLTRDAVFDASNYFATTKPPEGRALCRELGRCEQMVGHPETNHKRTVGTRW